MKQLSTNHILSILQRAIESTDNSGSIASGENWNSEELNYLSALGYLEVLRLDDTEDPLVTHLQPRKITRAGLQFVSERSWASWWDRQITALSSNFITIAIAVIIAVISAWLLEWIGPAPQANEAYQTEPTIAAPPTSQ